nr:MAG TPA_asm: hypothetical protein [Caudoviricetes sp.]
MICEGGVGFGKGNLENAFFFEKFYRGNDPPHPPALPVYPAGASPPTPARPERLHGTGDRADHATHRHTRPDAGHAGRSGRRRRWKAGSVSETVQKRTSQNLKNKYAKKRKYLLTFTQESV